MGDIETWDLTQGGTGGAPQEGQGGHMKTHQDQGPHPKGQEDTPRLCHHREGRGGTLRPGASPKGAQHRRGSVGTIRPRASPKGK